MKSAITIALNRSLWALAIIGVVLVCTVGLVYVAYSLDDRVDTLESYHE